jgi:hydrogenase expression/formation protein HypD
MIPGSGLGVRAEYSAWDAEVKFDLTGIQAIEPIDCHAGDVLRGQMKPFDCPAFGTRCTPEHPMGAPMVSSEGACAAYFNYGRFRKGSPLATL